MSKKLLLTISFIANAILLSAGSLNGESAPVAVADTIWITDTVFTDAPALYPEPVMKGTVRKSVKPAAGSDVPFDRGIGISNTIFIPKGTIGFGLSISYNDYSLGTASDDVGYRMLFSMLNGIHGGMTSFGVSPQMSYFFTNNTSVGLRFDYDKSSFSLGNANLSLGDDMSFSVSDMNYLKQSYTGALTLRHYMPIADSRRFAMFIEARGAFSYAQSKSYQTDSGNRFGTYQDIYKASLSIVPGMICFMADNAAFEVSVGVLGFDTERVVQTTNQVEVSEMKNSGANFKINLFSINFGMSFYIQTGRHRHRRA